MSLFNLSTATRCFAFLPNRSAFTVAASVALSLLLPALFVLVVVILRENAPNDETLWHGCEPAPARSHSRADRFRFPRPNCNWQFAFSRSNDVRAAARRISIRRSNRLDLVVPRLFCPSLARSRSGRILDSDDLRLARQAAELRDNDARDLMREKAGGSERSNFAARGD